ncbi:MAG: hypothetical protein JXI43_02170 [Tissierellales bacterium]|nr:hypothetical protein [Tissierellales bacterium]
MENIKNKKIERLVELFETPKIFTRNLQFFFIDGTRLFRFFNGELSLRFNAEELGFIKSLTLDRGAILNVFAIAEWFINEFFQIRLLNMSTEEDIAAIHELLSHSDFEQRVSLLRDWYEIRPKFADKLIDVSNVRYKSASVGIANRALYKRNSFYESEVTERYHYAIEQAFNTLFSYYSPQIQMAEQQFHEEWRVAWEQGRILDVLAKLEGCVNELLAFRFFNEEIRKPQMLTKLLAIVTFDHRIKLLGKWGILENELVQEINSVKRVRNELAHMWSEREAVYQGEKLEKTDTFSKFKEALEGIFSKLIYCYEKEWDKYNFDDYLAKIIEKLEDGVNKYNILNNDSCQKAKYPICPYCGEKEEYNFPLPESFVCKKCQKTFVTIVQRNPKTQDYMCYSMTEHEWEKFGFSILDPIVKTKIHQQ